MTTPNNQEDEPADLDVEAMVANLQRLTREQEIVASFRPDSDVLSTMLGKLAQLIYDVMDQNRQAACLSVGRVPSETYAWQGLVQSPVRMDRAAVDDLLEIHCSSAVSKSLAFAETNPTRNTIEWGVEFISRCVHTTVDHMYAVADLLASGRSVRAPLTLSRTVIEASATACSLSDTTVDTRERLRRCHNLRMAQTKEDANERAGEDAQQYFDELSDLVDFATTAEFDIRERRKHDPPFIRASPGRSDSIRQLIEEVLPDVGLSIYRNLSAVAHARATTSSLLPDEYTLPHEVEGWRKAQAVSWHMIPTLLVVRELCARISQYLGWNLYGIDDLIDETTRLFTFGAGWADNGIRIRLGMEPQQ